MHLGIKVSHVALCGLWRKQPCGQGKTNDLHLLPKVLGKVPRSPAPLFSSFLGQVSWGGRLYFYSVIDARCLCFIPDPFYYAFSFYQVYKS